MERLTIHHEDRRGLFYVVLKDNGFFTIDEAVKRLAAYEDTGLTPEEINELLHLSYGPLHKKLGEWIAAEQDGRLVVLPCKKGNRLFVLTSDSLTGIGETKCKRITIINREDGPCVKVIAPCVCDDWGGAFREFYPEDFGKTVFLTREEAEAELANQKEEQE